MCGIFGFVAHKDAGYDHAFIKKSLKMLAQLSASRGKDSSGLVFRNESTREFHVFKGPIYLNDLVKNKDVTDQMERMLRSSCNNLAGGEQHPEIADKIAAYLKTARTDSPDWEPKWQATKKTWN